MYLAPINYHRFFVKVFSDERIVRKFLEDNPDFPYRLRNKVLMAADPLFRAVDRQSRSSVDQ